MNTPIRRLASVVAVMFFLLMIGDTWVQFVTANSLNERPGNARTLYSALGRERGPILVGDSPIAQSVKSDGVYPFVRQYPKGPEYAALTGSFSIFGATGLEGSLHDWLSGTADQQFYSRIGGLLTGATPKGASVKLTIDPAIQDAAWNALGDRRGAVVAIEPSTGRILALVSKPTFDPNQYAKLSGDKLTAYNKALQNDDDRPLDNRAIAGNLYPPGSVFKVVTSSAALTTGSYTPESSIPGPAKLPLPNSKAVLPNDFDTACGPNDQVTLIEALRMSCNTAFASLGISLGDSTLRSQAEAFGFGQELQIPLKVAPSTFPDTLDPAQTALSAIGQFDVRVTPLQIAMVSAAIANGGSLMQPQLVEEVRDGGNLEIIQPFEPSTMGQAVTPTVANDLTSMMERVVQAGSGRKAQISGIRVAGKTGTAQTQKGQAPTVWFTAFAPAERPEIAVAVVVEEGGELGDEASGGKVSAPIAREVIEAAVR